MTVSVIPHAATKVSGTTPKRLVRRRNSLTTGTVICSPPLTRLRSADRSQCRSGSPAIAAVTSRYPKFGDHEWLTRWASIRSSQRSGFASTQSVATWMFVQPANTGSRW
nr:hypothetical protein [Kribbella qitaiheensis]